MSRVTLLYGEQGLLHEYNNHVAEKLDEKWPETMRKSNLTVGFTRGIRQMQQDIVKYRPASSFLKSPVGGLFDTKKHFYRLISLLLTDLGLVFHIRSPSPWQVISELRNRGIISESDSANLKVCLSIANEIRLKAYFANGGQKERFSPVRQSPDTTERSTDEPIFRDFDEDLLVRLLTISINLCKRCNEFCLKYVQQGKVEASILRKSFLVSKTLVMCDLYIRLQKFPKVLKLLKSISKDSPDYAQVAYYRGFCYHFKSEFKKAIECYETALEYSKNPSFILKVKCDLARSLCGNFQHKKGRNTFEEAIKLHDEIYGQGSETEILSIFLLCLGILFYELEDMPSAIQSLQRLEQMQKSKTRCIRDIDVIYLNIHMAKSYSKLCQNDKSLHYLEKALRLSHKVFGEHNLSDLLGNIYTQAALVYHECGLHHKAFSLLEYNLKLIESLYGDNPNAGKIVENSSVARVIVSGGGGAKCE